MDAATWGLIIATFVACFVEMVEATTIVMAMWFTRGWRSTLAGAFAALGVPVVVVLGIAVALRRPLSMINENLLKYGVGLLLASFGTYWAVEGIGIFRDGRESLGWPGHDLMILVLLAVWFVLSRIFVAALRKP